MPDLRIWTIYDHPRDYPEHIVVRAFDVRPDSSVVPSEDVILVDSLPQARAAMRQRGLFCLGRKLEDDPCIIESWI